MINWTGYLQSLCGDDKYVHWQQHYTVTDVVGRQPVDQKASPWLFDLMVQTVQSEKEESEEEREKTERFGVLEGLQKYAQKHVLLIGRPGSGKSTALIRLLLQEAQTRLEINFQANSKTRLKTTEYPVSSPFQRTSAMSQGINSLANSPIPVLVELRYYQTSVVDLIRSFLKQHGLLLDTAEIEKLLFEQQLLLLFDGVNELPSEVARRDLLAFRQENIATPMIFTTRDLGVGGDLNITNKLEMQPLTEPQMQQFVKNYLPGQGEQMLQQLGDRLREFGETPLLLMMLCSLFQQTHNIPPNLGMVFRQFTQFCENQRLEGVLVTDNSRRWWRLMLQHLALRMTQGKEKTELQVAISREEAEEILTAFLQQEQFDQPRDRAISWLNELLKYHLIQLAAEDKIEFRHQLIQEYYTAESLLKQLPDLLKNEDRLKREYLNYLKWTEPLVLMLELVEDEKQALQIVELALDVDLRLGARLAGAVKSEFQTPAVGFVAKLEVPQLVKIELLGITRSDQAISHIQPALNHKYSDVRNRAAEALGKIGGAEAVEIWKLALNHKYSDVRSRATEALGKIGCAEAVEVLKLALNHKYSDVRSRATEALGKIGGAEAVEVLKLALNHKYSDVRSRATEALGKIGCAEAIEVLKLALNDEHYYVRIRAAEALRKIGSAEAVEVLKLALNDEDDFVRISAAEALGKIRGAEAIEVLKLALNDEHYYVRIRAAEALRKIGSAEAVEVLKLALNDEDDFVRRRAAEALGKIGCAEAIEVLKLALNDEHYYVRRRAAEALGKIGDVEAVEVLKLALNDEHYYVRRRAAEALGKIGDVEAVEVLKLALNDEDDYVRRRAAEALGKIGDVEAVEVWKLALNNKYSDVRWRAANALGKIGDAEDVVVWKLALNNKYSDVRWRAAEALGEIGDAKAVEVLKLALNDEDNYVRIRAANALGKIGGAEAVEIFKLALKHEDLDVRISAAKALGEMGDAEAVEVWKLALNHEDDYVRISAAKALGEMGDAEAVEVLKLALNNKYSDVRWMAADALGKIAHPQLMPELNDILRTNTEIDLLYTIAAIQERCKFYNYTLTQPPLSLATPNSICMTTYNILHLSDLHFGTSENANNWYNQLAEDLYQELNCSRLDVLILSGDIANKSTPEEYNAAKQFLNKISEEFHLQPEQIVIVPGNHDLNWGLAKNAYKLIDIEDLQGTPTEGFYIKESENVIRIRDEEKYQQRFTHFSQFYQAIKNQPYPLEYEQQAILHHFPAQNLLILGLNSAWQLDHYYKTRASIKPEAINKAITDIRKNQQYHNCLKIAVWHHPLTSAFEDRITDHGFMEQLAKAGFRFALHGHIHKAETSLYKYDLSADGRKLDIICAGTFGAPIREWVPGYPLQYNLLKFADDQLTVHTRRREELNGAWKPDARWLMGAGQNPLPYYEIAL